MINTTPDQKVITGEYNEYGNREYPQLRHWSERVIHEKGRYRITEKLFEYMSYSYGFRPHPEVAMQRKIQVKALWLWWTIEKKDFRVNTNHIIAQSFLGEKYDWEYHWERHGMGKKVLDKLNQR